MVGTTKSAKAYWAMVMRKAQVLVVTMNCVCETFVDRVPEVKGGAMLGAKEAPVKGNQSGGI